MRRFKNYIAGFDAAARFILSILEPAILMGLLFGRNRLDDFHGSKFENNLTVLRAQKCRRSNLFVWHESQIKFITIITLLRLVLSIQTPTKRPSVGKAMKPRAFITPKLKCRHLDSEDGHRGKRQIRNLTRELCDRVTDPEFEEVSVIPQTCLSFQPYIEP